MKKTNVGSFAAAKLQAKMRSILAIALAAVIGLAFSACDEAGEDKLIVNETSGRLTVTGIPAQYNGKWILGDGDINGGASIVGNGFDGLNVSDAVKVKGAQITDGTATLKVWTYRTEEQGNTGNNVNKIMGNYNGSGNTGFYLQIHESEIAVISDRSGIAYGVVEVTFTNGIGSGVFVPEGN